MQQFKINNMKLVRIKLVSTIFLLSVFLLSVAVPGQTSAAFGFGAVYGPPNPYSNPLNKHIYVSLKKQELKYFEGNVQVGDFLVSTGVYGKDTPPGEYRVLHKYPFVDYIGTNYSYLKTQWNLLFIRGTEANSDYFIHGAYWHHNWGHRMSHGCVNVSYDDMAPLYMWADVGTPITIFTGDFANIPGPK